VLLTDSRTDIKGMPILNDLASNPALPTIRLLKSVLALPVDALRTGMYIVDLDCGWAATPFPLEGLLLEDHEDICTIALLAQQVTIDPGRSLFAALQELDQATLYDTSAGTTVQEEPANQRLQHYRERIRRDDGDRASRSGRLAYGWQTLRRMLLRWADRLLGRPVARRLPTAQRPDYIPDDIALVKYPQPEATYTAMPQAIAACAQGEAALERIAQDLLAHRDTDMDALQAASDTLAENMIRRPGTMIWAAKMRDRNNGIYHHGLSVAIYLTAMGRQLGFQREHMADLATVGLLLDLGKIELDHALLDKPGKLDAAEIIDMQTHVHRGIEMLMATGVTSSLILRAIAEHHERVDGTGYPERVPGSALTIFGKMAAIADAYAAMVNPRPYAPAYSPYEAMKQLFAESESRWFAPLVEQFVQAIGIFPVGSLVELSSGEVAIVIQHNPYRRLEPLILILTDSTKAKLTAPRELDMLKHNFSVAPDVLRIASGLPDGAHDIDMQDFYLRPA
jgi:HD-GYP domain-containing protein (c-di-GMP phosphodiesterase class II)